MARLNNVSGGSLILPDNTEIKAGDSADVSDDMIKASGVAEWIKAGQAEIGKASGKTKKRSGLEDQAEKLEVTFDDDTSDDDLIKAIKEAKAKKAD